MSPRRFLLYSLSLVALAIGFGACNSRPVEFSERTNAIEYREGTKVSQGEKIDILWVIDNSGSMCQEQRVLRNNFQSFVEKLEKRNLDFHISVTTTHMRKTAPLEPIAQPGFIQSTAQPKPSDFQDACHRKRNAQGDPVEGNFKPVRNAIEIARECAQNPEAVKPASEWSADQIECALGKIPAEQCQNKGIQTTSLRDIFPNPSAYRSIPKVIKASDYRKSDGTLDTEKVKRDFKCMSTVGTRGSGIEMGLKAATKAVSPDMTGGPVEAPIDKTAPNHGFIRQDAKFALIFVTDENDCSHSIGNLSGIRNQCAGDDWCEFLNRPGGLNGKTLTAPKKLANNFISNLGKSKKKPDLSLESDSVFVASIHGRYKRFDSEGTKSCKKRKSQVETACSSELGKAESGDRYERFLRNFGHFHPKPTGSGSDAHLPGLMCRGSFGSALAALGEAIPQSTGTCIAANEIMNCSGPSDTSCPSRQFLGTKGRCKAFPTTEGHYCDSALQVQIYPPSDAENSLQKLKSDKFGYCIQNSVNTATAPGGCVVKPEKYKLVGCAPGSGKDGITIQWEEVQYFEKLEGFSMIIRHSKLSRQSESSSASGPDVGSPGDASSTSNNSATDGGSTTDANQTLDQ